MNTPLLRAAAPLALLVSTLTTACAEVILEDQASGGTSSSSSSGGNSTGSSTSTGAAGGAPFACAPGDHLVTFGESAAGGATLGITSDAEGVYWTNGDGSVWRADPGGASPTRLAEGLGEPESIAVRGDQLFVVDYGHGLFGVDKHTGAAKLLAKGDHATVTAGPGGIYATDSSEVIKVSEDGSPPEIVAALPGASSLAADAEHVYAKVLGPAGDATARIVRIPGASGPAEDLVPIETQAYSYGWQEIAIDESRVYWVNPSEGTVSSAPKGGGAATVLASGLADPESVAVLDGEVYFTVRGKDGGPLSDRAVAKVPAAGGAITYLAHGPSVSAYGIALDAGFAYWTAKYTGGPVSAACR
ncbi:MAG: hypothetical protein U0359_29980 [Byssovorax sp.]